MQIAGAGSLLTSIGRAVRAGRQIELRGFIMEAVIISPPTIPLGRIKCFGPDGPKYEVGRALRQLADGDWMIEITMVESGEKAEYRMTHMHDDPEAR